MEISVFACMQQGAALVKEHGRNGPAPCAPRTTQCMHRSTQVFCTEEQRSAKRPARRQASSPHGRAHGLKGCACSNVCM